MYTIEMAETRAGRETVVVKQGTRRVCSASLDFVRWMHDRVPTKQLRDEQKALVNWYAKKEGQATSKTATVQLDLLRSLSLQPSTNGSAQNPTLRRESHTS
jgi:hypothetical protein